jgi:hypothetical protein
MNARTRVILSFLSLAALGAGVAAADGTDQRAPTTIVDPVTRGAYLVKGIGCAGCHTPRKPAAAGTEPELDTSRLFSGHAQDMLMPAAPRLPPGPWHALASATGTAWSGTRGTSFSANLTPDPETGIGKWTARAFIETIRTGRHLGRGRQLLPPMPWRAYAKLDDADLEAIFAYLKTIPPVKNRVPAPLPPAVAVSAGP